MVMDICSKQTLESDNMPSQLTWAGHMAFPVNSRKPLLIACAKLHAAVGRVL